MAAVPLDPTLAMVGGVGSAPLSVPKGTLCIESFHAVERALRRQDFTHNGLVNDELVKELSENAKTIAHTSEGAMLAITVAPAPQYS